MHELSIAQNIIDAVRDHVETKKLSHVRTVAMEIGAASGVVSESLLFAFRAIVQDTPLADATLEAKIIPFTVRCNECQHETENEFGYMVCGHCDSPDVTTLSGTEMILKHIELDDE